MRTAPPSKPETPPPTVETAALPEEMQEHMAPERADDTPDDLAKWGISASQYRSGVVIGIFAKGGVGKTTFIATANDSEYGGPVHLFSAGANPHTVRSRGNNVIVKDILRFDQLEQERQKVLRTGGARHVTGKESGYPFRTVAFDVVSEIHAMALRDEYGDAADVSWEMHSITTARVKQFIRNWRDLATHPNFKLNVIFSLWEIDEQRTVRGEKNCTVADVELSGKLQASFSGMVPFLGYLYVCDDVPERVPHGDGYLRCLDFRPIDKQQVSKFGVDADDEWASQVPLQIYDPSLASLIDVMHGQPWPAERHKDPRPKFSAAKK